MAVNRHVASANGKPVVVGSTGCTDVVPFILKKKDKFPATGKCRTQKTTTAASDSAWEGRHSGKQAGRNTQLWLSQNKTIAFRRRDSAASPSYISTSLENNNRINYEEETHRKQMQKAEWRHS